MFPLCGSCLCYMWMARLKQIISHFYTKSRAGVLNFIARHIIILVALKGPVVFEILDVQSTPLPLHQKSRVPQPPLHHSAPPLPCAAAGKKLETGLESRKCRTRGGLETPAGVCWMLRPGEAERRGCCGCTERHRICRRSSVLLSASDCWDEVWVEMRWVPQLLERCEGHMKLPRGPDSAPGPRFFTHVT